MKKVLFSLMCLVAAICMQAAELNIFASKLSVDEVGTQATISYDLNAPATALTLQLLNAAGEVVKQYPISDAANLTKGSHMAIVTTDEISEEGQTWAIKADGAAIETSAIVAVDSTALVTPRGVAVDTDPMSPYFGTIYVADPVSKLVSGGLYMYSALGKRDTMMLNGAFNLAAASPMHLYVAEDHQVIVSDWSDVNPNIVVFDPAQPTVVKRVFANNHCNGDGVDTTATGEQIHGSMAGAITKGVGANRVLYTIDEDVKVNGNLAIFRYNIGEMSSLWDKVPSDTFFMNTDNLLQNACNIICPDKNGGLWVSQYRWTDGKGIPSLMHITAAGAVDYNSAGALQIGKTTANRGAFALSPDQTEIAVIVDTELRLYTIEYPKADSIALSLKSTVAGVCVQNACYQVAFDYAGNVYVIENGKALKAVSFANANNSKVTPAYKHTRLDNAAPELNIFASQVAVAADAGNSVEVHYVLNAQAKELALIVCDAAGAEVSSNAITDMIHMTKGKHQFKMNVAAMPGADQHWAIKASAKPVKEYAEITNDTTNAYNFYLPQGVAVNNIPSNPYFGQIYVTNPVGGNTGKGRSVKAGLYVFDAALNAENEEAYQFGLTYATADANRTQFKRVKVGDDGMIYVNRQDATTCIYKIDPKNMGAVAETITDNKFTKIAAFAPDGDKMWVLDYGTEYTVYKIQSGVATKVVASATFANADVDMVPDGRGGVWIAQNRWNADTYSALTHIGAADTIDFKLTKTVRDASTKLQDLFPQANNISQRGTLALNSDKSILAFGGNKVVSLYAVSYDASTGVPSIDSVIWRSGTIGGNIDGIAFDAVDNLYFNSASTERFYVYTTPQAENSFISPATSDEMPGTVHVDSIVITPKASTDIEVGDNFTFNAAIFPANATNKKYTWSIADENIATISTKGVVTAVAKGNTMVYAVSDDNPAAIDSAVVTVIDKIWYYPNIYASALEIVPANEENQFHVAYVLNAPATGVNLIVTDTAGNQQSIALSGLEVGENAEDVNLDALAGGMYTWAIEAKAELKSDEEAILCNVGNSPTFVTPRGVAVNNNPASKYFGNVYVTESNSISDSAGLYMFDATYYTDGIMHLHHSTWGTNHYSPMRVTIGEDDDMLYISDWSDINPNIHVVNPANLDQETLVFGGTPDATGMTTSGSDSIHGSMSSCYVRGTGANRVLYTFDEDMNTGLHAKGLFQYNIGELTAPWTAKPSAVVYDNAANYEKNGNSVIIPDAFGGWWISQDRATDGSEVPALIHIDATGAVNYNSSGLLGGRTRGAIAFNKDQSMCVSAADNAIIVFLIEWNENHVPTLTKDYVISTGYGSQNSTCLYSLALDPAYNIYAVVDKKPLQVWAAIVEENKTVIDGVGTIEIVKTTGLIEMGEEEVGDVHKELENGRVVIIRNGQKYNMIGGNL